jgi:hypothetical protein
MKCYENICAHAFNAFYGECLRTSQSEDSRKEKHHRKGHKQEESTNVAHFSLPSFRRLLALSVIVPRGEFFLLPLNLFAFLCCFARFFCVWDAKSETWDESGGELGRLLMLLPPLPSTSRNIKKSEKKFFFSFMLCFEGGKKASERRLFNPPHRRQSVEREERKQKYYFP